MYLLYTHCLEMVDTCDRVGSSAMDTVDSLVVVVHVEMVPFVEIPVRPLAVVQRLPFEYAEDLVRALRLLLRLIPDKPVTDSLSLPNWPMERVALVELVHSDAAHSVNNRFISVIVFT